MASDPFSVIDKYIINFEKYPAKIMLFTNVMMPGKRSVEHHDGRESRAYQARSDCIGLN
jgi:hypothetical protein